MLSTDSFQAPIPTSEMCAGRAGGKPTLWPSYYVLREALPADYFGPELPLPPC